MQTFFRDGDTGGLERTRNRSVAAATAKATERPTMTIIRDIGYDPKSCLLSCPNQPQPKMNPDEGPTPQSDRDKVESDLSSRLSQLTDRKQQIRLKRIAKLSAQATPRPSSTSTPSPAPKPTSDPIPVSCICPIPLENDLIISRQGQVIHADSRAPHCGIQSAPQDNYNPSNGHLLSLSSIIPSLGESNYHNYT